VKTLRREVLPQAPSPMMTSFLEGGEKKSDVSERENCFGKGDRICIVLYF